MLRPFARGLKEVYLNCPGLRQLVDLPIWLRLGYFQKPGAPNVNFRKLSVRKTTWDLEFSEHLL